MVHFYFHKLTAVDLDNLYFVFYFDNVAGELILLLFLVARFSQKLTSLIDQVIMNVDLR